MRKFYIVSVLSVLAVLCLITPSAWSQTIVNGNSALVPGASISIQVPNSPTTGTSNNAPAKLASAPNGGSAVIATTSDVTGIIGIVLSGAGVVGNANIATVGEVSCVFDGATTANDYVTNSTTTSGTCHDSGSVLPTSQIIGRVLSTNGSAGTYKVMLGLTTGSLPVGGSNTNLQYNNSGVFGGAANWTYNGSTGLLTGAPTAVGNQALQVNSFSSGQTSPVAIFANNDSTSCLSSFCFQGQLISAFSASPPHNNAVVSIRGLNDSNRNVLYLGNNAGASWVGQFTTITAAGLGATEGNTDSGGGIAGWGWQTPNGQVPNGSGITTYPALFLVSQATLTGGVTDSGILFQTATGGGNKSSYLSGDGSLWLAGQKLGLTTGAGIAVRIETDATTASSYNFILPTTVGTSGYFLTSAAGGTMTWTAPPVTSSLAFSALTAATNSNAGTFAASGNAWDYGSATHTRPMVITTSGALPGSCSTGELAFATDSTAGQNIWQCNGGVWTQQLNSGTAGASTALSNLAAVAINTTLLPGAVNTVALGSSSLPFTNLFIGLAANQAFSFGNVGSLSANRTVNIPNATSSPVQDCPAVSNQFLTALAVSTGACTQTLIGVNSIGPNGYVAGAGIVNVMTATLSPVATSLVAGLRVQVLPNLANTTTTPTLNVNGLGAKTITKFGTTALVAGDYTTTAIADLIYDGSGWELQNPQTVANVVTASSTNTLTNKTYNAESTGNTLSEPIKAFFGAAGCNQSSAGPSMDIGTTNVPNPSCVGTTVRKGVLQFARGNTAYLNFHLPADWNSSAATDIELGFTTTDTTNGHITSFNIQTACNKVDGTATDDPSLNASQALSVTTGASQISGGMLVGTKTGLTMTGCVADYNFEVAITRNNSGTDTNTDTAVAVKFAELTFGVSKNAANR